MEPDIAFYWAGELVRMANRIRRQGNLPPVSREFGTPPTPAGVEAEGAVCQHLRQIVQCQDCWASMPYISVGHPPLSDWWRRLNSLEARLQTLVSHLEQRHGLDLPPTTESPMRDSPSGVVHCLDCERPMILWCLNCNRRQPAQERESPPESIDPAIPSSSPSGQPTMIFRVEPLCKCARQEMTLEWEASGGGREVIWHLNCKDCGACWCSVLIPAQAAPQSEMVEESE